MEEQKYDLNHNNADSQERSKGPRDRLADEIRRAFIEQQSDIVNEINKSINAEQVRSKNESR